MTIEEIKFTDLNPGEFIKQKVDEISSTAGDGIVVNALSGGVDSSVVTMLAHRALGDRLKTCFIENGLMREGEPQHIVSLFKDMGVKVEIVDAKEQFFAELKGKTDPEDKREAITKAFYAIVFARLARDSGVEYVLQGTNYTDVEETVAGIKRQHNIIEQLGIDPQKEYGYWSPSFSCANQACGRWAGSSAFRRSCTAGPRFPARPWPPGSSVRSRRIA